MRLAQRAAAPELTSREKDALQFLVTGKPNKDIAAQMNIEVGTVKTHLKSLYSKLGASTRTEAVRIAQSRGLLRPSDD